MRGYSEAEVFSALERDVLADAQLLVRRMPSHDQQGRWLRCHEIVRVLAPVLGLFVQDGYYGMVEHSWLWTSELAPFSQPPNILDSYCPGRLPQVQLVHSSANLPYEYRRGPIREDVRQDVILELQSLLGV